MTVTINQIKRIKLSPKTYNLQYSKLKHDIDECHKNKLRAEINIFDQTPYKLNIG